MLVLTVRAQALFLSDVSRNDPVTRKSLRTVVATMLRTHGGSRGCGCDVAYEFGRHPDQSVQRMRWALATVAALYPRKCACPAKPDADASQAGSDG